MAAVVLSIVLPRTVGGAERADPNNSRPESAEPGQSVPAAFPEAAAPSPFENEREKDDGAAKPAQKEDPLTPEETAEPAPEDSAAEPAPETEDPDSAFELPII